eukprot:GHVU01016095.1.p1 GENE.GHVU01016095.1~~GHVU01016095.1.p1  ORF type:complete len:118 (-),score=2.04 GHVU01016095.1:191-544(-)
MQIGPCKRWLRRRARRDLLVVVIVHRDSDEAEQLGGSIRVSIDAGGSMRQHAPQRYSYLLLDRVPSIKQQRTIDRILIYQHCEPLPLSTHSLPLPTLSGPALLPPRSLPAQGTTRPK